MAALLAPEWFEHLEQLLSGITIGAHDEDGLALGQIIHGGPNGTVQYTILLGKGVPGRLVRGSIDEAHVILVEEFESAIAIVQGMSVADLLASGKIKVRGDVNALLRATAELTALGSALATNDL